MVKTGHLASEM